MNTQSAIDSIHPSYTSPTLRIFVAWSCNRKPIFPNLPLHLQQHSQSILNPRSHSKCLNHPDPAERGTTSPAPAPTAKYIPHQASHETLADMHNRATTTAAETIPHRPEVVKPTATPITTPTMTVSLSSPYPCGMTKWRFRIEQEAEMEDRKLLL